VGVITAGKTPEEGSIRTGRIAGGSEKSDNCTFRVHKSVEELGEFFVFLLFFKTISKYTPARPDVKHAAKTAMNPFMGSIPSFDSEERLWTLPACTWTMPTPTASKISATHLDFVSVFLRRSTENNAVVRIFI